MVVWRVRRGREPSLSALIQDDLCHMPSFLGCQNDVLYMIHVPGSSRYTFAAACGVRGSGIFIFSLPGARSITLTPRLCVQLVCEMEWRI